MESLIYIANGMNLLGYCMKDMLRLRILMLAAAACLPGISTFARSL